MSAGDHRHATASLGALWVDWRNADEAGREQITEKTREAATTHARLGGWPRLCGLFDAFERSHGVEAAAWLDARWNGFEHDGGTWAS